MQLFPEITQSPLFFEVMMRRQGYRTVAGIDEAGRGPLAGPVVAAAVILPEVFDLPGLNDSKQLSEKKRNTLYPLIHQQALAVGVGVSQRRSGLRCYCCSLDAQRWCRCVAGHNKGHAGLGAASE